MEEKRQVYTIQPNCNHEKQQTYTQKRYDILNGFELTFTRCFSCHKILEIQAKKFTKH
jgi:hypothetical protein